MMPDELPPIRVTLLCDGASDRALLSAINHIDDYSALLTHVPSSDAFYDDMTRALQQMGYI